MGHGHWAGLLAVRSLQHLPGSTIDERPSGIATDQGRGREAGAGMNGWRLAEGISDGTAPPGRGGGRRC